MTTFGTAWPRNIARVFVIAAMAVGLHSGIASAKIPGETYCYYKTCHRVKTLAEMRALVGQEHTLPASFYDSCTKDPYNPCGLTSSGEVFRPDDADNAASPIYPNGTVLLVWSAASKQAAVLRINNSGPYWGNRKLDVSRAAAEKLGFKGRGVADLKVRVLHVPTRGEVAYRLKRRYQPVAGAIGKYASLDAAASAVDLAGPHMQQFAADEEARLMAIMRPALKTWPVVGRTSKQIAIARSKAMPWPVIANYTPKLKPPVGIAKTVAIAWPIVKAPKSNAVAAIKPGASKTANVRVASSPAKPALKPRVKTLSQQIAEAKALARHVKLEKTVAAPRIKPSRGLAAAVKAEEIIAKTKFAKLRGGKSGAPVAKKPSGKSVDIKKRPQKVTPLKVTWADPSFNLDIRSRITGQGPKLPSQYSPRESERTPKRPINTPRAMLKVSV